MEGENMFKAIKNLFDIEYKELTYDDKELFVDTYNEFIEDFKWGKVDGE